MRTDRAAVRARLIPFFEKDTPVAEITTERIDTYRAAALIGDERIGRGRALKPSSVQRDMTNLSAIFKRAVKNRWITESPYNEAERVKYVPPADFNVLSVPELEAVARAASTDEYAALYRVAGYTGLRFGELAALAWRDVEFIGGNLHVRRNRPVHSTEDKAPKSKRGRSLPLIDQAAAELDRLSRRGYLISPDDPVFAGETGRLDYERTKDDFYASVERAGLGRLRDKGRADHVPRSAPHLRDHDGGRLPAARLAGLHGPRADRDDDALPPSRPEGRSGGEGDGAHRGADAKRVPSVSRTSDFGHH